MLERWENKHIRMLNNKKSGIIHIFSLGLLSLTLFLSHFLSSNNKSVKADPDTVTDMSEIAILDGESIDTSHIVYDDFSGTSLNDKWVVSHRKWGGYDNKGVSADNVYLDTANDKVIIKALGNQHITTSTVAGIGGPVSGGALVLKETARPGRYETRLKAAYRVGVCNAFWTYTENNLGQNHEIDIEFPFKDNNGDNAFNEVIFTNYIGESNYQQTHTTLDYYLNDGEYHTYAFDWYYSNGHKEIRYYIDAHLLATHKIESRLPFLPSRLWLGCWVPNNPGFVGLPDFDECYMEIDYFKYSPFLNQDASTLGNAGGCGQTSLDYHIQSAGFSKYDWISNGSFNSINKNNNMEDRGYDVTGTVYLNNGYDHVGASNSGGLKMSTGATISQKIDSTYPDFKYKLSTYYKGDGEIKISFYSQNNSELSSLNVVIPNSEYWNQISYPFVIPDNTFYTVIKITSGTHELYIDDLSMVFGSEEPVDDVILLSIHLSGPNKTTYQIGEELDLTGLVVTGTYSDGVDRVITDYEVSEVDLSTSGTKEVVISVGEITAKFTIIVDEEGENSAYLTSIAVEGTFKTTYYVNEEIDFTGLIVKASYSDGSSKEITNYQINKPSTATPGIKKVTIIYIDKMTSFDITVNEKASFNQNIGMIVAIAAGGTAVLVASISITIVIVKKKKKA